MSLRRGTFEEIQQQAPFSRHAQRNMEALLRAWNGKGEAGFTQAWERTFAVGWDTAREPQEPIRIIGEGGDCQERALEVLGAPDRETVPAQSGGISSTPVIRTGSRDCISRQLPTKVAPITALTRLRFHRTSEGGFTSVCLW